MAAVPSPPPDCAGAEARLRLEIAGLRSDRGAVTVVLYGDRPEDFLVKGRRLAKARFPADPAGISACLPLPHGGTFALAAYHDEDGDGRFDRTFLGLPAEGYGFSNNPGTVAGLPAFSAVTFLARPGDTALAIRMRYP